MDKVGTTVLFSPVTIGIALAMAGLIGVGVLALIAGKLGLQKHVKPAMKWLFSFNGVFWLANIACMAYSAQNAGYIFGLYEWSGYAVGIIIDLFIIVFTQSMMTARARGERDRALKILYFIVFCCVLSLVGNVAHNLHMAGTIKQSNGLDGVWFGTYIPYIASVIPLFLIALAWVKDLKVDPLEFEDPAKYEEAEKKRIQYVQTQVNSRQKRAALEAQLIAVEKVEKQNKQLRKGKLPKSFRWFWEQPLAVDAIVAQVTTQLQTGYEVKVNALVEEIEALRSELASQPKAIVTEQKSEHLSEQQDTDPLPKLSDNSEPISELENEYNPFTEEDYEEDDVQDTSADFEWMKSELNSEPMSRLSPDTDPSQIVHCEQTPKPRITVKLSGLNRNTDNLTPANKKANTMKTVSVSSTKGDGAKRVERILKRKPDIALAELAERAKVSRSYAYEVRCKFQPKESA